MTVQPVLDPGMAAGEAEEIRLFCFHHAGGSAASFNTWRRRLPERIGLERVQLPGRDPTAAVPPHTDVETLIPPLATALLPLMDRPFAFYGHSLGALVSFELTRWLRAAGRPQPQALIVSGRRAPQLPLSQPSMHDMPEDRLIPRLEEMGGLSRALENLKWRGHFLPIMRADLQMSDLYRYRPEPPLDLPLLAFRGEADCIIAAHEIAAWEAQTTGRFAVATLPGRHFFTAAGTEQLQAAIIAELTGSPRPAGDQGAM